MLYFQVTIEWKKKKKNTSSDKRFRYVNLGRTRDDNAVSVWTGARCAYMKVVNKHTTAALKDNVFVWAVY